MQPEEMIGRIAVSLSSFVLMAKIIILAIHRSLSGGAAGTGRVILNGDLEGLGPR